MMQRTPFIRAMVLLLLVIPIAALGALGNPEEGDFQPVEGRENWEHRFDISELEEGKYNLVIRGTDQAGNVALEGPFNLFIDPASDLPVVHVSNPAAGQRAGSLLNVVGTCLDDDAVDRVEVQLDEGTFQSAEGGELWSLLLDLKNLSEGEHLLTVRGVDVNGNAGEPETVTFNLDQGPPVVEISSHPNGALVSGRVTLEGRATDGNGVSAVSIRVNQEESYNRVRVRFDKEEQLYRFSHDLDTRDLPDGPLVLWFRATDRAGTTGEQAFLLFVNNEAPVLEILAPQEDAELDGMVTVVGRALDKIGLTGLRFESSDGQGGEVELLPGNPYWSHSFDFSATKQVNVQIVFTLENRTGNLASQKLRLKIDPEADRPVARIAFPSDGAVLTGTVAVAGFLLDDDGGGHIDYSVDGGAAQRVPAADAFSFELAGLKPGRHTVSITATDVGGVAGKPTSIGFILAGEAPQIAIKGVVVEGAETPFYPGVSLPEEAKTALSGEIRAAGPSLKAEVRFGDAPYKNLTLKRGDSEEVRLFDVPLPRELPPGRVELGIRATDAFGRTGEYRSFFFKGAAPENLGILLDDARIGEVVRLTGGQPLFGFFGSGTIAAVELVPPVPEVNVRGEDTRITLEALRPGVSEPTRIRVTGTDGSAHETGPYRFATDTQAPELRVSEPDPGAWVGTEVVLEGVAEDDSPLIRLEYALGEAENFTPLALEAGGEDSASRATVSLEGLADGPHLIFLRAEDAAGNTTLLPLPVLKDTTAPQVGLIAPSTEDELNGLISLIGQVEDAGRIVSIEFTEDGETYSSVGSERVFRHDLNLSRYETLPATLAFRVTDASGNNAIFSPDLNVDLEADRPVVEIQIPIEGETIRSDFMISGMVFDDDAVGGISYRIDGGEFVDLSAGNNFSIPVDIDLIGDNEHVVEVKAVDIGGAESAVASVSFLVSTSEPVSLLTSPRIDEVVRGVVELVGTSEDPNGIKEVYVSFDNGHSFQRMNGTEKWSYPLDSPLLDDGTLALLIRAVDGTGTDGLFTTTINIDNRAPDIQLDTPQDGVVLAGRLSLGGRVYDNVELASLTAWLTPAGSQDATTGDVAGTSATEAAVGAVEQITTAPEARRFTLEADGVFNREVDISDLPPGWYNLMLEAADRADNRRYVARNVRIVETAAAETIELLYPAQGERLSGVVSISGQALSEHALGDVVLVVDEKVQGSAQVDPRGYFRFDLEPGAMAEGEHVLRVEAGGADTRVVSESRMLRYEQKGAWVQVVSHNPGQFVTGRPFLEGRAGFLLPGEAVESEDAAPDGEGKGRSKNREAPRVMEVAVSFDNGKSFAKAAGKDNWRLRLETGELPNGPLHVLVKATFSNQEIAITRTLLHVDTRAPELALLDPQEGGRFNEEITVLGSAHDNAELAEVTVSLRRGDKSRYAVPKFIQGMYLDVHALGATYADVGIGLSFFDDNVKLQVQAGLSPPGRFSGLVVGAKLLANIATVPFSFFFGPSWDFFSMSFALGANFSYFTMSGDEIAFTEEGLVLGAVVAQLEFARFRIPDWRLLHTYSLYSEFQLWFISSDVEGGLAPRLSFGFRLGLL